MLKGSRLLLGMALLSTITLSACSSGGTNGTPQAAVNKGTVPLEAIKVGCPESVFKEALITFIPDQTGTTKEKNQYLSRFTDPSGGQYVVQAKDDISFEVAIVHRDKTLTKEQAMATIKRLLPTNVTAEPVLVKAAKATGVETYKVGTGYQAVITYKDKTMQDVSMVTVSRLPNADVAAATQPQ